MENTFTASASLRNFRGSARKARLILDMVRGKKVTDAKNILRFSTKKMSKDILTLLNSAVANAHNIHGRVDENNLIVAEAYANEGVTMKRMMLAIKGMAYHIRKRYCHITLNLDTIAAPPTTEEDTTKPRRQKTAAPKTEESPSVGNGLIRSASETDTDQATEEATVEPISQSAEATEEAPVEPISQSAEATEEAPVESISQSAETTEEAIVEPISESAEATEETPQQPTEEE